MTRIIHGLDAVDPPFAASVLTVGNFDGVNRAHQHLLSQGALLSAATGHPLVVLTFEPHPLTVVAPDRAPARLTSESEKIRLLGEAGVDVVVVAHADAKLLGMTAEEFVQDVICELFHPSHLVEGANFGFGRGRKGDNETLRRLGRELGFQTCVVEPLKLQVEPGQAAETVSSTLVRRLLREGKVQQASACLGRRYVLEGQIGRAQQRGRSLGFPTANLQVEDQLIPAEGVYAGFAQIGPARHSAAISIGRTPTFGENVLQIEAHLLDFEGDLCGKTMRLEFQRWLRAQKRFESPEALIAQIEADVACVRRFTMKGLGRLGNNG